MDCFFWNRQATFCCSKWFFQIVANVFASNATFSAFSRSTRKYTVLQTTACKIVHMSFWKSLSLEVSCQFWSILQLFSKCVYKKIFFHISKDAEHAFFNAQFANNHCHLWTRNGRTLGRILFASQPHLQKVQTVQMEARILRFRSKLGDQKSKKLDYT